MSAFRCGSLVGLAVVVLLAGGFSAGMLRADDDPSHSAQAESEGEADRHAADSHDEEGHGDDAHGAAAHGGANTNPLSIDPDLAIFTAVVFLLMLAFLGKFAWKPLAAGLDSREQSISDKIDQANRNFEQASLQLKEYEQKLAAAADEARNVVAKARTDAEAVADRIRDEAQEDAKRERDRALADIDTAKNLALGELAQRAGDVAVSTAGRIIQREIQKSDHEQLIQESLDQLAQRN